MLNSKENTAHTDVLQEWQTATKGKQGLSSPRTESRIDSPLTSPNRFACIANLDGESNVDAQELTAITDFVLAISSDKELHIPMRGVTMKCGASSSKSNTFNPSIGLHKPSLSKGIVLPKI